MKTVFLIFLLFVQVSVVNAQLKLGSAKAEINFREGPGLNYKVVSTIDSSNLLVILPREPVNKFVEVFDVETNMSGYVSENLIHVNDTLFPAKSRFDEKSEKKSTGDIEIELVNKTIQTVFVWINKISYKLSPYEKKVLIMTDEEITYFSSAPGLYPIFGKEIMKKGSTYRWTFSL
jgi:uncharacterized protein YgiM (DUF1202 family)